MYFVAQRDICPGTSIAAKGPGSQPVSPQGPWWSFQDGSFEPFFHKLVLSGSQSPATGWWLTPHGEGFNEESPGQKELGVSLGEQCQSLLVIAKNEETGATYMEIKT